MAIAAIQDDSRHDCHERDENDDGYCDPKGSICTALALHTDVVHVVGLVVGARKIINFFFLLF